MSVTRLWSDGVPPSIERALHGFECELIAAIDKARVANLPQGLVVALLHAHTQQQTNILLEVQG